jgi:hypothetical protein
MSSAVPDRDFRRMVTMADALSPSCGSGRPVGETRCLILSREGAVSKSDVDR